MTVPSFHVEAKKIARRRSPFWDWFNSLVEKEDNGCWWWRGAIVKGGYGRIFKDGRKQYVHRISYERAAGYLPEDLDVLHSCDNPACINPAHLFLGTQTDNNNDMWAKGRARVPLGEKHGNHKLTEQYVRDIRESELDFSILAEKYGVTRQLIVYVRRGTIWKHVQ